MAYKLLIALATLALFCGTCSAQGRKKDNLNCAYFDAPMDTVTNATDCLDMFNAADPVYELNEMPGAWQEDEDILEVSKH